MQPGFILILTPLNDDGSFIAYMSDNRLYLAQRLTS